MLLKAAGWIKFDVDCRSTVVQFLSDSEMRSLECWHWGLLKLCAITHSLKVPKYFLIFSVRLYPQHVEARQYPEEDPECFLKIHQLGH